MLLISKYYTQFIIMSILNQICNISALNFLRDGEIDTYRGNITDLKER